MFSRGHPVGGQGRRSSAAITVLVFAGLIVSGLVNAWIEAPDDGALPGIALSSQTLLVVERSIAFFAAWLLVLVVAVQALEGRLPIEISGRGLRYAEADRSQDSLASTSEALRDLDNVTSELRRRMMSIEAESQRQHEC